MVTWIQSSLQLTEIIPNNQLPSVLVDRPSVPSCNLIRNNHYLCYDSLLLYSYSPKLFRTVTLLSVLVNVPTEHCPLRAQRESGHRPSPPGLGCSSKFWILCYTDWPKINLCAPSLFHTCYERQPLFNFHRIRLSKVSTVAGLPVNSSCTSTQLSCNYLYDPWPGNYRACPKMNLNIS